MSKRSSARAAKMQKLLAKVQTLNLDSGGSWKPPEGTTILRILPAVHDMDYFFQEFGSHYNQNGVGCRKIVLDGEDCPVCELAQEFYSAGDKDQGGKFRAVPRFLLNIIVRSEESAGPRMWYCPKTVFSTICTLLQDDEYGLIYDIDEGFDLKLKRTGQSMDTKYDLRASRHESVLHSDPDQVDEWLEIAKDLTVFAMSKVYDYDETIVKAGLQAYFGGEEDDEKYDGYDEDSNAWDEEKEAEVEVEEVPKPKASERIRSRMKGSRNRRSTRR